MTIELVAGVLGVLVWMTLRWRRRRRRIRPAPLGYVRLADRYYDGRGRFPED